MDGTFFPPSDSPNSNGVYLGTMLIDTDPALFAKAQRMIDNPHREGDSNHSEYNDAVKRFAEAICERVKFCRGKIDGECWALGAKAVYEVLRDIKE